MGVSQKAFNEKQRRRAFSGSFKSRELPENVTKELIVCKNCGFKARYEFVRCPECEELRK